MGGYIDVKRSTKDEKFIFDHRLHRFTCWKRQKNCYFRCNYRKWHSTRRSLPVYKAASKKSTGKGQTENKKKCGSSSSSKVSVENKDNDDNQGDSGLGIEQDYHDEMDHEKYEKYFETQICKNVSKNSALVIDNASYHSKYSEDHPKSTWKKAQYAEWLKKERSLNMQKMLYDRPYGSWQKKSGRITLHIGWKKLPTNMDMK